MTALADHSPRGFYAGNAEMWAYLPMAAALDGIEGALMGIDTNGDVVDLSGATYPFVGIAVEREDNTDGIAEALRIKLKIQGVMEVDVVGVDDYDDINKPVYAADNGTLTLTAAGGAKIGKVFEWTAGSGTLCKVFFKSCLLRDAQDFSQIAALVDDSGGAAGNGTIGVVTAPTALAATLTDSTGGSGTHDDTLADGLNSTAPDAVTGTALGDLVATQNTGWGASTEAGFDSISTKFDAAIVDIAMLRARVLVLQTDAVIQNQNDSDLAQKVIEIVTAQAANRLAIVALTDAVTELATKVNALTAALKL